MSTNQLFTSCAKDMMSHAFLAHNPVITGVKNGTITQTKLAEVLCQYVRLPEVIVSFLQAAASHFPENHGLHQELKRNWEQEQGSATGNVAHVEILKAGLKKNLGVNADQIISHQATEHFLTSIRDGMKENTWFALGQAYALEASAVPELALLVGPAINAYTTLIGKEAPIKKNALQENGQYSLPTIHTKNEALAMDMSTWFAMHIMDFEVGHRDFLQHQAKIALLNGGDEAEFKRGFDHVLDLMDEWWEALAK